MIASVIPDTASLAVDVFLQVGEVVDATTSALQTVPANPIDNVSIDWKNDRFCWFSTLSY